MGAAEQQMAASLTPEQKSAVGRLIKAGRDPKIALRNVVGQDAAHASVEPSMADNAKAFAAHFADTAVMPDTSNYSLGAMGVAAPTLLPVQVPLRLARDALGIDEKLQALGDQAPAAALAGTGAGAIAGLATGPKAGRLDKASAAAKATETANAGVPILQRAKEAMQGAVGRVDDAAKAHPVLEKIAKVVGGERVSALRDLVRLGRKPKADVGDVPDLQPTAPPLGGMDEALALMQHRAPKPPKPPVAGPANAAKPTLDVPEPTPAVVDDAPAVDPDWPTTTVNEAPVPWYPDGSPFAAPMQPGTSVGRQRTPAQRPAIVPDEAAGAADVESAVSAPALEPAVAPPVEAPDAPMGAVDDAPLDLEALTPKIDAPPPLASIESAPVDDLQALAARARQRGINQRFSKGGQRERAQLQALNGKAERQAFFDDLANLHGQRQTAPLAREFALEMPATAPRFSSMPGWMRQASNTGAHTGRQEASGAPFADAGGNGPAIREAFAQSRAPIADDAAQGLTLEAQGAAALRPGQAFDAASGQPLSKYRPKDEAERAALMALPPDKFDAVIEGRMTLEQAQGGTPKKTLDMRPEMAGGGPESVAQFRSRIANEIREAEAAERAARATGDAEKIKAARANLAAVEERVISQQNDRYK